MHTPNWFNAEMNPLSANQPLNILHGISVLPAAVNNVAIRVLLTPEYRYIKMVSFEFCRVD